MPGVRVRPATVDDSAAILRWRNDPVTRGMSASTSAVPQAQHDRWYAAVLADPDRHLLMGERTDASPAPIGMVRFDRMRRPPVDATAPHDCTTCAQDAACAYEVSVNLAPQARGRGLSSGLLSAGTAWLSARQKALVVAHIRVDNTAAQHMCDQAGFREHRRADGWIHMTRQVERQPATI